MSTNIECTNCHDVVELTADSIMLPFICDGCENDAEQYEKMAPAVTIKSYDEFPNLITEPLVEPSHDATVENTTLLIADLEQQVAMSDKALNDANVLIADMSAQLQDDAANIGERDRRLTEVLSENSKLNTMNERLMMDISTVIDRKNALALQNERLGVAAFKQNVAYATFIDESFQIAADADKAVTQSQGEAKYWEEKFRQSSAESESWRKATGDMLGQRDRIREMYKDARGVISELRVQLTSLKRRGFLNRVFNVGA